MDDLFNIIYNELSNQYDLNAQRRIERRNRQRDLDEFYGFELDESSSSSSRQPSVDDESNFLDIIDNMHCIRRRIEAQTAVTEPEQAELSHLDRHILNMNISTHSYDVPLLTRPDISNTRRNTSIQTLTSLMNVDVSVVTRMFSDFLDASLNADDEFFVPEEELEDVKVTLSDKEFSELEGVRIDESNIANFTDNCTICLEKFGCTQDVVILKCKHYFHVDCIRSWLTRESLKCCTCRMRQR